MPFTPFHMGFGLAAKAAGDQRIGLVSFGMAQVLMDLEPGVRMITGQGDLHGWSHTVVGALGIAALATVGSRWLTRWLVRRWNAESAHYALNWLCVPVVASYRVLGAGALVGTLSHLLLDSLIHADMRPLAPFTSVNPLLGLVAHDTVYSAMVVLGMVGMVVWLIRRRLSASQSVSD